MNTNPSKRASPDISRYLAPSRLADAVEALADGDVTILCGGTDLAPQTASGQKEHAGTLMNIRRIEGLSGISVEDDTVRIGALTTITDMLTSELLRDLAPVLVEAADRFASDQIRNAASIGGNICNASPAGDMIIPLLVLDTAVELACWRNGRVHTRLMPLDGFFVGPGRTARQDSELLTAVTFERPERGFVARFRKPGPRPALEISTVSVGIGCIPADGRLHDVRVAMGAVAPTPVRARAMERALAGRSPDVATIDAAIEAAADNMTPIDDVRASAWYRNHLVGVLTREILNDVTQNRD